MVTLESICAAQHRIKDAIYHSPTPYSLSLSKLCGCDIYCKLDHLQMTGSFKERGARNKLLTLPEHQRKAGVVTASAGNHALGLAYHGHLLGIPVTVVMPKWAPLVKVANCRSFGVDVILHGESFDEARSQAMQLATDKNLVYIHGFDDPDIISGQGTLGLEVLEDVRDLDAILVPVGGGGLIAGVATAVKAINPKVKVIGVESKHAPTMFESMRAGKVVRVATQPTLADGLAIAEAGRLCFEIVSKLVDQIVLVDEVQIATAILRLLEMEKTVVEGAGAVPLAAAMSHTLGLEGKKVVLALCGGNIDVTTIARVIERGLASDGRLCRITAAISDRPGSLARFLGIVASTGASVKEVSHDRNFGPADVAKVTISAILETRDAQHIAELHETLHNAGIAFTG